MAPNEDIEDDDTATVTVPDPKSQSRPISPAERTSDKVYKRLFDVTVYTKGATVTDSVRAVDETEAIRLVIVAHGLKSHTCRSRAVSSDLTATQLAVEAAEEDEE